MGTGNGVIISVPLAGPKDMVRSASQQLAAAFDGPAPAEKPGKVMRVYNDTKNQFMTAETFIPYCCMSQAQLSFHGHRDAVKFFVSVPGNGGLTTSSAQSPSHATSSSLKMAPKCINEGKEHANSMLVMSGGEGYIDFRIGKF